jgi:hypothetical protein
MTIFIFTLFLMIIACGLLAVGYLLTGRIFKRSSCGGAGTQSLSGCKKTKDGSCDICSK